MQLAGIWLLARAGRAVAATTGLMVLLALLPEPARLVETAPARVATGETAARTLVLSEQARRFLTLQYRSFPTEFMGCMIGEVRGQTVFVQRIAPADVEPTQSAATHVVPKQTCEGAGWQGTVGVIHSHPAGERCWYFFPSTQVATSDGQSFAQQPYPVDAIMCGAKVVWIARDLVQREVPLNREAAVPAPQHRRGNRVHDGAASPKGE